ncbi:radical SAM protein [Novimethylophilus kurashikiensis]|nr:radical SAM protein [Novimethylophilus kurashikiensis]
MYIQITTRCNMTCAHCCFSATAKGTNMDRYTFITALEMAVSMGDHVTIGGGEPTTHPEFFVFLDKAMEYFEAGKLDMPPLVVTNGKLVTKVRKLLDYVEEGRPVTVELSQDEYHDPIRPEIVDAFKKHQRAKDSQSRFSSSYLELNDGRGAGIRTVSIISPVGRAAEPARGILTSTAEHLQCCCETPLVSPEGLVYSCGCKHHLLGNIFEGQSVLEGYDLELAHQGGGLPCRDIASVQQYLAEAA